MSNLTLPDIKVGSIVVSPSQEVDDITEDKHYIVQDIEGDWLMLTDDSGNTRYYQSHFFIEADIYYNMLLWLTLMRLYDMNPKEL